MRTPTSMFLTKLRKLMAAEVPALAAYIVPSCDAHNSEYLSKCDERRSFISGFTGSMGTAVVTDSSALLWTDGRYYLQAESQMDDNWQLMREGQPETLTQADWLATNLESGSCVGVDPFLVPRSRWSSLKDRLESANIKLVAVQTNLVDTVWGSSRPDRPNRPIVPLELKYTGQAWESKVAQVRERMREKQADMLVLSALDDVAWLLNLRGSDIQYNPVFFAYVVVSLDRVHLFVNEIQVTNEVRQHLKPDKDIANVVDIRPYGSITAFLSGQKGKRVWLGGTASQALGSVLEAHNKVTVSVTPVTLMKAIKNPVELEGFARCHIRDAAALCSFFAWLEKSVPSGTVTEVSAAAKLATLRAEMEDFVGLSFATISSVGPNAAVIHYSPSPETDRTISPEEIYLVDSGGQYKDGTTDVTRTVHFGQPTDFEKEAYTRVLKGQLALAMAVFPRGLKGNYLDTLARLPLWQAGLDYAHGTGHGVGAYLNVHEGPMGISWRPYPDDPGLQAGMVLSDEPGFYMDGKFGVRLENLVKVVDADTPKHPGYEGKRFLTFEPLTLVPIQFKMVDPSLLTAQEVAYIDSYHQKCVDNVGPLLRDMGHAEGLKWLIKETTPVG